jgi:hypothetical protein
MKSKTIKKTIRAKIDAWLASIEDPAVRMLASNNTIVTGGCIASMLLKEPVNDFDIYFRNKEATTAIANYYVDRFKVETTKGIACKITVETYRDRVSIKIKSAGIASEDGTDEPYRYFEGQPPENGRAEAYVGSVMGDPGQIQDQYDETEAAALATDDDDDAGKPNPKCARCGGSGLVFDGGDLEPCQCVKSKYRPVFMSTNAITLSNRVQLITRFFGEPAEIHANYDFVHCTNHWQSWDNELVLHKDALETLLSKELRYVGSKYPVCSLIRLRKFIGRGWTVNAGQILKMVMQVNELDLYDIRVLQDQLTGVDAAYFCELMSKLKEKDPDKVNAAYLVEIIDRMF